MSQPDLNALAEVLGEFLSLLRSEQQALVQNRFADLITIAQDKLVKSARIDHTLQTLNHQVVELGLGKDIPDWVRNIPGSEPAEQWLKIDSLAREAKALNLSNGHLIDTRSEANNLLLKTLQDQVSLSDGYDAQGKKTSFMGRLPIDKA